MHLPATASRDSNTSNIKATPDRTKLSKFKNIQKKPHETIKKSRHPTNHHHHHHHHHSFRPSQSMPHELWQDAIGSDRDVWVERSCLGRYHKKKTPFRKRQQQQQQQRRIVYYYSLQTGQSKLLEPPTGASCILLESEQEILSQQAQEWLANETEQVPDNLRGVKPPKWSLDVEKKREKSFFRRQRK